VFCPVDRTTGPESPERVQKKITRMSNKKSKPETSSAATPESVVAGLERALAGVRDLSAQRLEAKLSVARLNGVARELRELIKVMSVYGV
jgi:hypothetical protein